MISAARHDAPLGVRMCQGKKTHQGVRRKKAALHQGITWCNSTVALGLPGVWLEKCAGKNYRARYYDPQTGRFLSSDPIGFDGGMNFYSYTGNDPVGDSDPSGLKLDPKPGNGPQGGIDLADYLMALQYLNQDPQAAAIIAVLEARNRVFHVVFIHDGNDRFDPATSTIYWDPRSALGGCDHGGAQTPALGLYHEMTHGAGDGPKAQGYADTPDAQYENREERRVIRTYEVPFALRHGEGIRHSHDGNPYDSIGPTSTIPAVHLPHGPAFPIPPGLQRAGGCGCSH